MVALLQINVLGGISFIPMKEKDLQGKCGC